MRVARSMTLLPHSFLGRLLALLALLTLPWLVLIGHELWERHELAAANGLVTVRQRSQLLAREVDETLQGARRLVDFLAQRPEVQQADARGCQALLAGLVGIDPLLANAGVIAPDGRLLCVSLPGTAWKAEQVRTDPEFIAAMGSRTLVVGRPSWGPVARRPVMALARSVQNAEGRTVGVALVTLDLQAWSRTWARHATEPGSSVVVQNEAGQVVARYPEPERFIGQDARARFEAFLRAHPSGAGAGPGMDGVRRLFATDDLPEWKWKVGAGIPEAALLEPARAAVRRTAAGLAGLAALMWLLGWRLSRRLVAPLKQLTGTARAVAEGRPEARADEALPGELGTLAREFNRMLAARDAAQARLLASERRFREMLDTVELFAYAVDHEGRITYCNDFFLRRTGWRFEELSGDDHGERAVPPERRGQKTQWLQALREGRMPTHNEAEILTRGGERRLVRWYSTVLRDERGTVIGRASIGEDVTDQRRAERQVGRLSGFLAAMSRTQRAIIHRAERHVLLQEACDACVDAGQAHIASVWWCTPGGLVASAWAGPAEALFGPMPARQDPRADGFDASLLGRALQQGLVGVSPHMADDPHAGAWRQRAEAAGVQAQAVFPLRRAGEVVGVLMLHIDAAEGFDDALVELLRQLADDLAFALDNLAREQARVAAEQGLAAREHQLTGVVETAMDAIVTCDAEQRVLMFNRAAAELFGVPAEQVLGRPLDDLVPIEFRERHRRGVEAFLNGGRDQATLGRDKLLYGERADGERFPFEAAVSRQGEGAQTTITAVIRDLRERQAAEAARAAVVAAEAASRAKTEFLSRMSHELRTPLNAMLGFAQLLADDPREPLSPRQRRHLGHTREAGWHLLALIDDVLDVSRIEAGEVEMAMAPVALAPLIESALSVAATLASRHRVLLAPPPPMPAGLAALADATRLRQVVLNLLSNGCKYNRPGGVVAIEAGPLPAGEGGEGPQVHIDVVDDGLGMTEAQMARLFEPFNRLGREQGTVEGTGIGLHLSRQLVHKMGGRIEAASTPGRGTRMRVVLRAVAGPPEAGGPAPSGAPPEAAAPMGAGTPHGEVLYVEDNPVNLMLVEQFLLRWPGVRLTGAETGGAGLALLRERPFDLVLLDMQLPDMHGTELLHALRADGRLGTVPVVALSASAMPEAVDAALAAGAAEYWTKPLHLGRLDADLRRFLRVA